MGLRDAKATDRLRSQFAISTSDALFDPRRPGILNSLSVLGHGVSDLSTGQQNAGTDDEGDGRTIIGSEQTVDATDTE